MDVFIDTTEIRQSPMLTGPEWEKLARFLGRQGVTGIFPQVVMDEVKNHLREDLAKLQSDSVRLRQRLLNLGLTTACPEIDAGVLLEDCIGRLQRRVDELGFIVLAYPETSVEKYVSRALGRRKPFDGAGRKGFRDAVIWETILARVKDTEGSVVFVTSNTKDFTDENELAADLRADLDNVNGCGRVTICNGLSEFIRGHVDPTLVTDDAIAAQMQQGEFKNFRPRKFLLGLQAEIKRAIDQAIVFDPDLGFHVHGIGGMHVSRLDDALAINSVRVFRLNDGEVAVTMVAEVAATVTGYAPDSTLPEDEEFTWNSRFEVQVDAIIRESDGAIQRASISDVRRQER